jgi:hypothetical protein
LVGSVGNAVSVFVWTAAEDLFQNHLDRRMHFVATIWRFAILSSFWQTTGTVAYVGPDLCRTGLAQRMELARSQCGQIKTASWRLAMFLREPEALKCSRHKTTSNQNLPDHLNWQILS